MHCLLIFVMPITTGNLRNHAPPTEAGGTLTRQQAVDPARAAEPPCPAPFCGAGGSSARHRYLMERTHSVIADGDRIAVQIRVGFPLSALCRHAGAFCVHRQVSIEVRSVAELRVMTPCGLFSRSDQRSPSVRNGGLLRVRKRMGFDHFAIETLEQRA